MQGLSTAKGGSGFNPAADECTCAGSADRTAEMHDQAKLRNLRQLWFSRIPAQSRYFSVNEKPQGMALRHKKDL
jgi:ribosomal protein L20